MEITGPDAIAVLPDDSFVIADLIANRLLRYDKAGNLLDKIELDDLGIVNVADLRARGYDLFLLEINSGFLPPRYRVNQLSINGKLIARYDIPESFGDAQGLTGIALDCDGSVLVELEGGYYLYRLKDFQNSVATPTPSGYYCNNQIFQIVRSDSPGRRALMAGDARYETQLTTDFGGLRLLNVFHDGSFYVSREDVVNDSVIKVDQTLHFINAEKENQGVARIPVAEAYYYIMRNTVANEKGEVFVLLPRRDSLDVVRLNFYQSLEPLPPSTIIPEVTLQTGQP